MTRGARVRRRLNVRGVVQGVGFRPFVVRLAEDLGLTGTVGNDSSSVLVEIEGDPRAVDEFTKRVAQDAPALAQVVAVTAVDLQPVGSVGFSIVPSAKVLGERTLVPPDVATCEACLTELTNPADRRFRHPFITCTDCGPRFTIIEDLPYDRPATTMREFEMCGACAREYQDHTDRRYHAQPVSCHDCGPRLWLVEHGDRIDGAEASLRGAIERLRRGGIVAIKGIGGFHLACDATAEVAVARLRRLKRRPAKPFAVMARDLLTAAGIAELDTTSADLLRQPARPIVLVPRTSRSSIADSVAPGLAELGVLLPYTPLHHLVLDEVVLLVMTSGNLSDEPLCYENEDALERLGGIADAFLMHDRRIAVPCEDSVVTVLDGGELPLRRSRGYAPMPVFLDGAGPTVLAVGAEVKNTFTITRGDLAFCSAHLGDMGSLESQDAYERSVAQLMALHGVEPELIVADDHPGYQTTSWAERRSTETGTPLTTVQHHHAHLASLLAEHGATNLPCIGVTYDGTGYSCDRTVWGGELLYVDGDISTAARVGHLEQFDLPGGDRAVREPWRVAMALLRLARIDDPWGLSLSVNVPRAARELVGSQLASGVGVVRTSSAGRLFDGVAALLGVRHEVAYEAQAAIELEHLARSASQAVRLTIPVEAGVLGLGPMIEALVAALRDGARTDALALGFHEALADATALLVIRRASTLGTDLVGLTGGVMQNKLFVSRLAEVLRQAGLRVLTHRVVPPNDGGLSLGQAVVGRARLANKRLSHDGIDDHPTNQPFANRQLSGREGDD
ncbi:MAG: carbamoyltransferase HypF [Nocardioides sp.]|nr:carbamoyltransferase HypF [Nocardioides sp.]